MSVEQRTCKNFLLFLFFQSKPLHLQCSDSLLNNIGSWCPTGEGGGGGNTTRLTEWFGVCLHVIIITEPKYTTTNVADKWLSKGKVFTLQAWAGPWGSGRLRLRIFSTFGTMKVVRSSPLRTAVFTPRSFLVLIFRGWVDATAHGSGGSYGKNPQRHHWGSIPRPSD
jgi:hypothetical protein